MEMLSAVDSDAQRSVSPLRVRNEGDEVEVNIEDVIMIEKHVSGKCPGTAETVSMVDSDAHRPVPRFRFEVKEMTYNGIDKIWL